MIGDDDGDDDDDDDGGDDDGDDDGGGEDDDLPDVPSSVVPKTCQGAFFGEVILPGSCLSTGRKTQVLNGL